MSDTSAAGKLPDQTLRPTMPVMQALGVLSRARREHQLVITHQGSARLWPLVSDHPLDFHYNPSTMGGAIPLGLGLALGRPELEVVVLTGDGSLLMNLGALVSVVSSGATNLSVVLLDNGVYEVTGGQATPAQGTPLDYAQLARAIGFATTCRVDDLDELRTRIDTALAGPGPRFLWLCVGAAEAADLQTPPTPLPEQLRRLQPKLPKLQR